MSEGINVVSRTQIVIVDPITSAVSIINAGPPGPSTPGGEWISMTQAEYDALPVKDPDTLYVISGPGAVWLSMTQAQYDALPVKDPDVLYVILP